MTANTTLLESGSTEVVDSRALPGRPASLVQYGEGRSMSLLLWLQASRKKVPRLFPMGGKSGQSMLQRYGPQLSKIKFVFESRSSVPCCMVALIGVDPRIGYAFARSTTVAIRANERYMFIIGFDWSGETSNTARIYDIQSCENEHQLTYQSCHLYCITFLVR